MNGTPTRCEKPTKTSLRLFGLFGLWALLVMGGFASLSHYAMSAGGLAPPPKAEAAGITVSSSRHTLVVAVHPKCPCTRATLASLQQLVRKHGDAIELQFLVFVPAGTDRDTWMHEARRRLSSYGFDSGVIEDVDGEVSAAAGSVTSGSVVLYTPKGEPAFWGGLTSSRGHSGPSTGRTAIESILEGSTAEVTTTPVYGCSMCTRAEQACSEKECETTP